ncbi:MAG: class I adenylate-forming enzyme family protein [Acidimicrobiales bacterium]
MAVAHGEETGHMDKPMSLAEADRHLTAPGQMFEMEEIAIRGIPTRVWKHAPGSMRDVLELSRAHGDKTYLVYEDERTTFDEHYRIVATLARALAERFGLRNGMRVTVAMRNLPEWAMAFWAAAVSGAVVVPLNAWWTGAELEYGLADSGTTVAFVDAERLERLAPHLGALPDLRAVVVTDEHRSGFTPPSDLAVPVVTFDELIADRTPDVTLPDVGIDPEDDATIFYTSGTTGRPKGAVGTHRNMCTNLMSLFFINSRQSLRGSSGIGDAPSVEQNAYLLSVPLFHATGCHSILVANTAAGNKLVMMHHWDPERALDLIERERITTFGGVPAMVMQVIDAPSFSTRDTSSVRAVAYGGAPAPPELVRRIKEHFPVSAPSNGYGLTETSSVTTMNSGDDYVARPDSVGPPVPVVDVAVVPESFEGDEPSADLPTGPEVLGELWIKGPNVVRGYWNKPEATATAFTKGWLHSGDVARLDEDGFVYIVDRAKDMVIRGGENVYSVEVEAALFEHPAVADCAVIGVPHDVLGEEVGAAIVLRSGMTATPEELALHVRARLASFKVPAHYWFRSEPLPRNPQGKILKRELREELTGPVPR